MKKYDLKDLYNLLDEACKKLRPKYRLLKSSEIDYKIESN
jgi:hypothetical protein